MAASLIVVLLMALLYKIEQRIETGAAAPVPTQGQLTTDTSNAVATWKAQIVALRNKAIKITRQYAVEAEN